MENFITIKENVIAEITEKKIKIHSKSNKSRKQARRRRKNQ